MSNSASETTIYPFTAFRFSVTIIIPDHPDPLCSASFAECDGLEMNMDVKTIREGGNNAAQVRLFGAVNYGTLTLKRGMTANFDLWDWFESLYDAAEPNQPPKPITRGDVRITVFAADGMTANVKFFLERCLPLKLKAPSLNAKDGIVAIEELQLAYEWLSRVRN
jgi:phage tail-like protein